MNKRGQVWVETVIYTLIALVIIGLVLSFIQPKIQEVQDKSVLQQSISMLNNIDNVISSIAQAGPGNKREVQIGLTQGSLMIDGINGKIIFSMNSHYQFSEPRQNVMYGNILVYTEPVGSINRVNMTLNYNQTYNLTYEGENKAIVITQSSTPYKLFISNNGGNVTDIDFTLG